MIRCRVRVRTERSGALARRIVRTGPAAPTDRGGSGRAQVADPAIPLPEPQASGVRGLWAEVGRHRPPALAVGRSARTVIQPDR
jgi:hypothetical protein